MDNPRVLTDSCGIGAGTDKLSLAHHDLTVKLKVMYHDLGTTEYWQLLEVALPAYPSLLLRLPVTTYHDHIRLAILK